jgi:hypothetical protein
MDFFERWFGSSPDAGDGSFELLLIAFAVLLGCAVVATLKRRQKYALASAHRKAASDDATVTDGFAQVGLGQGRDQSRAAP